MVLTPSGRVRDALARQAYTEGRVRLVERDLTGCSHLVATRRGLFAANAQGLRLIAHGMFYGLAVEPDAILAFESCDQPRRRSRMGRLVRFARNCDSIDAAAVIATGLDNGCHQLDLIDGQLCVTDTYNQAILRFARGGGVPDVLRPLAGGATQDWNDGYAHINSVIAAGEQILLMLHNGAEHTGRCSEIAVLDRDWRLRERVTLSGQGCHSFAVLENGAVLCCGSMAGELIGSDGTAVPVAAMMTRGLSVGDDMIVVGGTARASREQRDDLPGALFFLDRDYRRQAQVSVPGPPMDIRRLDGADRSQSTHLARIGAIIAPFAR